MVHAGRNLPEIGGKCDSYVMVTIGSREMKTSIHKNSADPVWNQPILMQVPLNELTLYAVVEVRDYDPVGMDTVLGTVYLPLFATATYSRQQWFPLGRAPGSKIDCEGELFLEVTVVNPHPISDALKRRFDNFCQVRGFHMNVLAAADVAETLRSVSPPASTSPAPASPTRASPSSVAHPAAAAVLSPPRYQPEEQVDETRPEPDDGQDPPVLSEAEPLLSSPTHESAQALATSEGVSDGLLAGLHGYRESDSEGGSVSMPSVLHDKLCTSEDNLTTAKSGHDNFSGADTEQELMQVPGVLEEIEVYIPDAILSTQSQRAVADVYLTDFRLVLICGAFEPVVHSACSEEDDGAEKECAQPTARNNKDDENGEAVATEYGGGSEEGSAGNEIDASPMHQGKVRMQLGTQVDLSTYVPLGMLMEVTCRNPKSGKIARRESESAIQESSSLYMQLVIRCRDFRTLTLTFTGTGNTDVLARYINSLHDRLQYLILNAHTQPPALHTGCLSANYWSWYDPVTEFARQGAIDSGVEDGRLTPWRVCTINENYEVCPTYPRVWCVPRCLDDETVAGSAAFRSKGRLPILCYYNKRVGNALVRCAQPKVGATGRRSEADEILVHAVRQTGPDPTMLVIFDARSSLAEKGNKLMGKGSEAKDNYRQTKVMFMEIQNIHSVRASVDALQALCEEGSEDKWLSKLEATGWLKHVRSVLSAGCALARKMANQKLSCLVHCSDGWDRTSQMTSLCQLMLDPYFRTIEGFCLLIEKEWLSFGHMFTSRTYAPANPVERSPIFLLFLDCVWQTIQQFPKSFEFGESMLILLADHFQSGWFGNFLCDCERDRNDFGISQITTSLWSHISAVRSELVAPEYDPTVVGGELIIPVCSMKRLTLWTGYFLRHEFEATRVTATSADEPSTQNEQNTIVWVPDVDAKACKDCGLKFTVTRRRHHCRACGHVFCGECSSNRAALPSFGYDSRERVCDACFARLNRASDSAGTQSSGNWQSQRILRADTGWWSKLK